MTEYYRHTDCDKAILEDRLDDACEGCKDGTIKLSDGPEPPIPSIGLHIEAYRDGRPLKGYPFDLPYFSAIDTLELKGDNGLVIHIKALQPGTKYHDRQNRT